MEKLRELKDENAVDIVDEKMEGTCAFILDECYKLLNVYVSTLELDYQTATEDECHRSARFYVEKIITLLKRYNLIF